MYALYYSVTGVDVVKQNTKRPLDVLLIHRPTKSDASIEEFYYPLKRWNTFV